MPEAGLAACRSGDSVGGRNAMRVRVGETAGGLAVNGSFILQ